MSTKIKILLVTIGLILGLLGGVSITKDTSIGGGLGTINQLSHLLASGSNIELSSTTANFRIPSLINCDTIDTNATGILACGTDSGGGGSQTPWTSFIDGGGFGLYNVGSTTGSIFTATSTNATSTFPNVSITQLLVSGDYINDFAGTGLSISGGLLNAEVQTSNLHSAVTLSGTPNYITLSGQDIVRGTVDVGDDTNLVGGTNITLSTNTLNVDDAFLINDGDDTTSGLLTIGGGFVSQSSSTITNTLTLSPLTTEGLVTNSVAGLLSSTSTIAQNFIDSDIARDTELHSAVTFSGSGTYISLSGQAITVDPITESDISDLTHTTNTNLSEEAVEDFAGALIASSTGTHTLITVTYQDATSDIDFVVDNDLSNYSNATSLFFDTAGTNISNTGSTLNVDDSFLVNDADDTTSGKLTIAGGFISQASSTIVGDFSIDDSGKLKIPANLNPSLSIAGDLEINTTSASSSIRYYDGSAERAIFPTGFGGLPFSSSTLSYVGNYDDGSAGTSTIILLNSPTPITLTEYYCITSGTTTNASVVIEFGDGTASSSAACDGNGGFTTPTNNTFVRGESLFIAIGTQSNNPDIITISPEIRQDAD